HGRDWVRGGAEVQLLGDDEADFALGGEDVDAGLQLRLTAARLRLALAGGEHELAELRGPAHAERGDGRRGDGRATGGQRQRAGLAEVELDPDRRGDDRERAEQ